MLTPFAKAASARMACSSPLPASESVAQRGVSEGDGGRAGDGARHIGDAVMHDVTDDEGGVVGLSDGRFRCSPWSTATSTITLPSVMRLTTVLADQVRSLSAWDQNGADDDVRLGDLLVDHERARVQGLDRPLKTSSR